MPLENLPRVLIVSMNLYSPIAIAIAGHSDGQTGDDDTSG